MCSLLSGVALVTGSSSGIGQATAISFAKNGVRQLALLDVDPVGAKTTEAQIMKIAPNAELLSVVVDISDETSIMDAISQVVKRFHRIDYAVNNAGIGGPIAPSTTISGAQFDAVVGLNMRGMWVCQREEIKQMLTQEPLDGSGRRNRGVIVNMSSMLGIVSPCAATPATPYTASKHGVIGITKGDANFYAKDNIRVNAICPGYVNTATMSSAVGQSDIMLAEKAKVPLGRFAMVEEIAETICFLASPMSSYITGASLVVDGGFTAQ